jgi:hypothetical protein
MATEDDHDAGKVLAGGDYLVGTVPDPEAEPPAAERAHARTFAELVDKTLAGRTPPAMSADDRALLEVATVIRAASVEVALSATKRRTVVEDALRQAVGGSAASGAAIVPLAPGRVRRAVPWAVICASTLAAAAALIALWLRGPTRVARVETQVPATWRSRPADALVGEIRPAQAADASTRIDTIFADRLDGYRERRLSGGKP